MFRKLFSTVVVLGIAGIAVGDEYVGFKVTDYQEQAPSAAVLVDRGSGPQPESTGPITISLHSSPDPSVNAGYMTTDASGRGRVRYTALLDISSPLLLDPLLGNGSPYTWRLVYDAPWQTEVVNGVPKPVARLSVSGNVATAPNGSRIQINNDIIHIWGSSRAVGDVEVDSVNPVTLNPTPHLIHLPTSVGADTFRMADRGTMTSVITDVHTAAPALTFYGLIVLGILLAGTAIWAFRRRSLNREPGLA